LYETARPLAHAPHDFIVECAKCITDQGELDSIFASLPPTFIEGLNKACTAFEVLNDYRLQSSGPSHCIRGTTASNAHCPVLSETIETVWEVQRDKGLWRREYDPVTGRRLRFFSSSSVLRWMGYDPEEFLAKMQRRELPVQLTEFEFVAFVCDTLVAEQLSATSRVYRYRRKPGVFQLMQVMTSRTFDSFGRILRVEEVMQPVSVAELNAVMEEDPASVRVTYMGSCEGYAGAGTRVDAETLLASAEKDFEKGKIACMMKHAEGRALVQGLADELAVAVAPALKIAEKIIADRGQRDSAM